MKRYVDRATLTMRSRGQEAVQERYLTKLKYCCTDQLKQHFVHPSFLPSIHEVNNVFVPKCENNSFESSFVRASVTIKHT